MVLLLVVVLILAVLVGRWWQCKYFLVTSVLVWVLAVMLVVFGAGAAVGIGGHFCNTDAAGVSDTADGTL